MRQGVRGEQMALVWTHPLLHAFATPAAAYAVDADAAPSPTSPLRPSTPQPTAPAIRLPLRPSASPSALACSIFLLARAFRPSLLINPTTHG